MRTKCESGGTPEQIYPCCDSNEQAVPLNNFGKEL